jgi:hypothetical protein
LLKRLPRAAEVASVAAMMASEGAGAMTGRRPRDLRLARLSAPGPDYA